MLKNILRTFIALWYLLGWTVHVYISVISPQPQLYQAFGTTALIPFLKDLWQNIVIPNSMLFGPLCAVFQLTVGILMIGKGRRVQVALAASLLFNLFLLQLGLALPADTWVSDFLANRLPVLIFAAVQVPLLWCIFDRSVPELIAARLRRLKQPRPA